MRLCFLDTALEPSGRTRAFADVAGLLTARGHDVTRVCARERRAAKHAGAETPAIVPVQTDGGWLRVAWRLRAILRRELIDVVFVHSELEQLSAAAAVRLADRGAVVRRLEPLAQLTLGNKGKLARRLAPTASLFSLDRDLRAATPYAGALEPAVAPPGVDGTTASGIVASDPAARTVLVVHDGAHPTALSATFRALALLAERHSDLRVIVVGPRDANDVVRLQLAALRIAPIVTLTERGSDAAAVRERIAGSILAVVLADADDGAFAILDCQASGVPVIAERNSLTTAFIVDGDTGILTTKVEVAGQAALIANLLAGDARRVELVRAGREAAARWPLKAMADGFERAARSAHDRVRWVV